jgi:hypothetical protein
VGGPGLAFETWGVPVGSRLIEMNVLGPERKAIEGHPFVVVEPVTGETGRPAVSHISKSRCGAPGDCCGDRAKRWALADFLSRLVAVLEPESARANVYEENNWERLLRRSNSFTRGVKLANSSLQYPSLRAETLSPTRLPRPELSM